ncbi:MAG: ribulose-phosphate 3-epimerase [Acidimicrobiales bacterium]
MPAPPECRIAPSILSADFADLATAIDRIAGETNLLHVDVMDGHFVPNLTIGPPVVAAIDRHTDMTLDCHLMMTNPGDYLEAFRAAGADWISVHVEIGGTAELIAEMRALGVTPGLAINPETPFEEIEPWIGAVDHVLVMTVHPGFGGQSFMADVVPKIERIAKVAARTQTLVEVDGGIDAMTIAVVAAAGARCFVAGKAVFGRSDPAGAVRDLQRAAAAAVGS